ncbi:hypothetical protein T06_1806 [Trichinella sp. T6]|nr:hypothetical protein T06_1806 [Trichinella sp. T6]
MKNGNWNEVMESQNEHLKLSLIFTALCSSRLNPFA